MIGPDAIGPVYVITDPGAARPVAEQARAAARGGAWAVQLRDKTATDAEIAGLARALLAELRPLGVRLFVNDRLAVARATGADLHIGQTDGCPNAARAALAPEQMLGLSVETVAQVAAVPDGVTYLGAGPVRETATKPDAAAALGLDGIAAVVRAARLPVVAIGGLGAADAGPLRAAGAAGMAVVSAVTRAPDPEAATRALLEAWQARGRAA
jgi:thiamine-phosphate pyrophosphorylase